jgi:hypothetical protein
MAVANKNIAMLAMINAIVPIIDNQKTVPADIATPRSPQVKLQVLPDVVCGFIIREQLKLQTKIGRCILKYA